MQILYSFCAHLPHRQLILFQGKVLKGFNYIMFVGKYVLFWFLFFFTF
jgi:hypothetical protein